MAMNHELQRYLGVPYKFEHGPQARLGAWVFREGMNCQLLVHLAMQEFYGVSLPAEIGSKEIFKGNGWFYPVDKDTLAVGDVFLFGRQHEVDPRRLHLAVYIGSQENTAVPLLMHATSIEGCVSIWPLEKFLVHDRYRQLYGIRRLVLKSDA